MVLWLVAFWTCAGGLLASSYPVCMVGAVALLIMTIAVGFEFTRQS